MSVFKSTVFFLAFSATATAFAEQDARQPEEVNVVASRTEVPLKQTGVSVSVLDEDDLQRRHAAILADILRTLPGVQVSQSGGLGKTTSVRLRGEEAHRTLLLIDGINVSDASGPQVMPRFDHLLSNMLGRVEVLRGPQGMMYGADAGGVVSVTSKRTDKSFAGDVALESGEFDTRSAAANVRGDNEWLNYSITAIDVASDGFNARDIDTEGEKDGYDNTTLHGRAAFKLADHSTLELIARDVDARSEYDGCGWPSSNGCASYTEQRSYRAALDSEWQKYSQTLSYASNETQNQDILTDDGNTAFAADGKVEQFQYVGGYRFNDQLQLQAGVDHKTEELDDGANGDTETRDNLGVWFEGRVVPAKGFSYSIGGRYDDNEDFGEHWSTRLAAAYLQSLSVGELKYRASYSTGFRAPSLYELAYNRGEFVPATAPQSFVEEESRGYDLGVDWYLENGAVVSATWFDTDIENEIYFDLAAFCCYLQDEGETESRGVELQATYPLGSHLQIEGSYTWNDTALSDNTTLNGAEGGDPRARRPEHYFSAGIYGNWLNDRLQGALLYRGSEDSVEYPFGATEPQQLDDYRVLNFNGSWQVTPLVQLYLRAENLLDEDYQEVAGYNSAGQSVYLGGRLSF